MYTFTPAQLRNALIYLSFFHILIISASNYLVQFPFTIASIHNTWGALTFPFIFLTTDLTVRIFGRKQARAIIFWVMWPALLISYIVSLLFQNGAWAGWHNLNQFNTFVGRIALASFAAYAVGQLLDIFIFNRLRQAKSWWLAPATSTVLGSGIDSIIFFSIAFYHSTDAFMAANWVQIGVLDYAFKLFISAFFFLPAYGILLKYLTQKLTHLEVSEKSIDLTNKPLRKC